MLTEKNHVRNSSNANARSIAYHRSVTTNRYAEGKAEVIGIKEKSIGTNSNTTRRTFHQRLVIQCGRSKRMMCSCGSWASNRTRGGITSKDDKMPPCPRSLSSWSTEESIIRVM